VTDLLGDVRQIRLEHLRRPGKLGPQLWALGRDPHRTGVEVAGAHHDAALGQKRRSAKAVLIGAQQRGDHYVATRLDASVHAQANPPTQIVDAQRLLGLSQADSPTAFRHFDRRQWAGPRPAIHAGDMHDIGQALDHAGGDRPDTGFGDQLDGDQRQRIDLLQVIDQLREVLDGIDVVMRRRRDQSDPLLGVPEAAISAVAL